ncbi:MAG: hypothetical protein HY898_25100 [Deltaproteobacteria bacterium]|nr:hypothetical protein [Deltaproteobacteria bacterium]
MTARSGTLPCRRTNSRRLTGPEHSRSFQGEFVMRINLFGELVVDVDENRVILAPTAGRGKHFTFFFRPNTSGRHAGLLTPHTTQGRIRRTLARLQPEAMRGFFGRMENALTNEFMARTTFVRPSELCLEGWSVIVPIKDEELADLVQTLEGAESESCYRLDGAGIQRMASAVLQRTASPSILESAEFPRTRQIWAVRNNEEGKEEVCVLMFLPASSLGPVGWYATPVPFASRGFLERLFRENLGIKGFEKAKAVGRFLGNA